MRRYVIRLINVVIFAGAGLLLYALARQPQASTAINTGEENNFGVPTEIQVRIGSIQRMTLSRRITAYGRIEPAPADSQHPAALARVASELTLPVAHVLCIEGQSVTKGQALIDLDSRASDADIQRARIVSAATQALNQELPASSPLWLLDAGKLAAILAGAQAEHATDMRQLLTIAAPIDGVVTAMHVGDGEMASPGTVLVEITDTRRLVAAMDVPAFYLEPFDSVKLGQPADLKTRPAATRPTIVPSKVIFIDPSVDPGSGMASVNLSAPADAGLRPGQFIQADIVVETQNDCLAVPANAIARDLQGNACIGLVSPDHRQARLVPVQTGIRDGDMMQITGQGLDSGQTIVTTGVAGLVNQSGIRVVGD